MSTKYKIANYIKRTRCHLPRICHELGTPPTVARVISCVFRLRSTLSKLRLQGGKESTVFPSCKMRRDSGEFLAFPNPTGTLLSEAHFSSPQLSRFKDFVPSVKWPRQWGTSCVPELHRHAASRSSFSFPRPHVAWESHGRG